MEIKHEGDLRNWTDQLETILDLHDLLYIKKDISEPDGESEKKKWKYNRLRVYNIIQPSLRHISDRLDEAGWDRSNKNPKVLFELVQSTVLITPHTMVTKLFAEIGSFDQRNFSTLSAYHSRLIKV